MKKKHIVLLLVWKWRMKMDKKTTLRELLKSTPNIPVKIKTTGSRWLYAYYNDDKVERRINKENEIFIKEMNDRLLKRVIQYDTLDQTLQKKLEMIKALKGKSKVYKETLRQKAIAKYQKDKETLPRVIENQRAKIKAYTPYLDRKVKRVWNVANMTPYESKDTLYIEISGNDIGQYDDIHDYAYQHRLKLRDSDMFWKNNLSKRKNRKSGDSKFDIPLVSPKKHSKYMVKRDSDGKALGLVEINKGKEE